MQWTSAPNIGKAPLPQRARGYWKARISAAGDELEKLLEAERTQLPPWIVIAFGSGIAAWFTFEARGYSDCSRDSCVALVREGGREWRLPATRSSTFIDWQAFTRAHADIVVSDRRLPRVPRACEPRWLKLGAPMLRRTGGLAIYLGSKPRVDSVADRLGAHPRAQSTETRIRSTPRARFPTDR